MFDSTNVHETVSIPSDKRNLRDCDGAHMKAPHTQMRVRGLRSICAGVYFFFVPGKNPASRTALTYGRRLVIRSSASGTARQMDEASTSVRVSM